MHFFIYIFIIIYFIGCGSEQKQNIQTNIQLASDQSTYNEINITKAKEAILNQVDNVIEIYEAKDKKSLFVYKALPSYEKAYGLYEYDITVFPPIIRNDIISGYRAYIDHLIPLDKGKLIYQTTVFRTKIILYDYIRNKEIREYDVGYLNYGERIEVSDDENFLFIDRFKFDIHDIYKTYSLGDFEIDYSNELLIDHTNNLIWEYKITNQQEYNLTLSEAINFCKTKGNLWRLPTMQDIISYSNINLGEFKYKLFKPLPTFDHDYWIAPENILEEYSFTVQESNVINFVLRPTDTKNSVICVKTGSIE